METIAKETQTTEETLLYFIEDFFDCRKLSEHLFFLDYWMEKILINRPHKKYLNQTDLIFFTNKFLHLLKICDEINTPSSENLFYFEESIKIPENYIIKEQKLLISYPNYLKTKEICNPFLAFHAVFKNYSLAYYTHSLQKWLTDSFSTQNEPESITLIFPTYKNLKRIIEACWLIHERSISKNSFQQINTHVNQLDFPLSCPLLLTEEYLNDPYLIVESFFSFASLNEYREDLTQWFKAAINEHQRSENASDILFIHNQFIQLIHAGYIIGHLQLDYIPKTNYSTSYNTFGHWLLAKMEVPYHIQALSPYFKEYPLRYCIENLTLQHVTKLRLGLKEWLEASLSKSCSITTLEYPYIFDQFEDLQKIMEALFLLIIKPAITN